jgi:hypothetical protein
MRISAVVLVGNKVPCAEPAALKEMVPMGVPRCNEDVHSQNDLPCRKSCLGAGHDMGRQAGLAGSHD